MKKTYINPKMKVVELKPRKLLTNSLPTGTKSTKPEDSDAPEFDFDDF